MMPGHLAGKIQPARACSCRVIATMTDLVCASVACAGSYSDILGEARREQTMLGISRRRLSVLDRTVGRWARPRSGEGAMLESRS